MKKQEKKLLKNYFELSAIYLRELQNGNMTIDKYIEKIALSSKNTLTMLELE